jgi:hypothetical protein
MKPVETTLFYIQWAAEPLRMRLIYLSIKFKMTEKKNYPNFSNQCFWDLDYKILDFENDKRFIIERVVSRGGSNDEIELFKYYGWNVIKKEVQNIKYLNSKILNYLSILFEINKEYFRAYKNTGLF